MMYTYTANELVQNIANNMVFYRYPLTLRSARDVLDTMSSTQDGGGFAPVSDAVAQHFGHFPAATKAGLEAARKRFEGLLVPYEASRCVRVLCFDIDQSHDQKLQEWLQAWGLILEAPGKNRWAFVRKSNSVEQSIVSAMNHADTTKKYNVLFISSNPESIASAKDFGVKIQSLTKACLLCGNQSLQMVCSDCEWD